MRRLRELCFPWKKCIRIFRVGAGIGDGVVLTADFLSSTVLGVDSVFQFDILKALPSGILRMILLLGGAWNYRSFLQLVYTKGTECLSEDGESAYDGKDDDSFWVCRGF